MREETVHILHIFQIAATDLQAVVAAISFPSYTSQYTIQVAEALSLGRIPPRWMPDGIVGASGGMSSGDEPDLADWRYLLQARLEFLRGFRDLPNGQPPVWELWVLAYPRAVLSAVVRSFALDNAISTSSVAFRTAVMSPQDGGGRDEGATTCPPSSGIYVGGIYLQGARWDVGMSCLEEAEKDRAHNALPTVWFLPTHKGALAGSGTLTGLPVWDCPLYSVPGHAMAHEDRELAVLRLETRRSPDAWTRADVVAVLSVSGMASW
jgi:dynein heavy chain